MKILLATSKAIPSGGGIASYNQELVNALGYENEIHLLTDSDEHDVPDYISTHTTFGNSVYDYDYVKRLVSNINDANYDCIINSASDFLPIIIPFLNANVVSVSHFVDGKWACNAGYNAKYQNAIIALSEYGKNFILKKFKISNSSKVKVLYNFVKSDPSHKNNKKITRRPLRIVYPGGTSVSKSSDVVQLLVYRLLKSKLDFEFFWLGGTKLPSSNLSLFGLHDTSDLFIKDPRLHITGCIPRAQAEEIIGSANIFILPSRKEGCPMTLLEAMRAGCISIVSDAHHGSREIMELSKAGLIKRQGSSKALYDTIKDIIQKHDDYIHLYDVSHKYMCETLSQKNWAEGMKKIITCATDGPDKIIKPITENDLKKSYRHFMKLMYADRLNTKIRSGYFRLKFDLSYLVNRIGWIKC